MAEELQSDPQTPAKPIRQPQGSYPARLDDSGRMKLPARVLEYFQSLNEDIFVTSVDETTARIYPISLWMASLENASNQWEPAKFRMFMRKAGHFGTETRIDKGGRIQFNSVLRRERHLENENLNLVPMHGYYEVVRDAEMYVAEKDTNNNLADEFDAAARRKQ